MQKGILIKSWNCIPAVRSFTSLRCGGKTRAYPRKPESSGRSVSLCSMRPKRGGIETIDGYLAAPHKEDALADGILHPNDEGMACYSEYAAKIFMKYGLTEDFWPGWFACRY